MKNENVKIYQEAYKIISRAKNPEMILSVFKRSDEKTDGIIFIRNRDLHGIMREYKDMNELKKEIDNGELKRFCKV